VPTATVQEMDADDVVDPGDAALQELLAAIAERTDDTDKRDRLIDHILTGPPLSEWPAASREQLRETCAFVIGLARQLRQSRRDR
jgi:hypothetical protein